jgi:hypothetical protein
VFGLFVSSSAVAGTITDLGGGIIQDTATGRMWVAHGIGFGSSYLFPAGFANAWVDQLNTTALGGGYDDWRLPTVALDQHGIPLAGTGELFGLYSNLLAWDSTRNSWPFGLGMQSYGGAIIYTNQPNPNLAGNYWGLSFGSGSYSSVFVGYAYAWVGTLAVRDGIPGDDDGPDPVPEPATLLLVGGGLAVVGRARRRAS